MQMLPSCGDGPCTLQALPEPGACYLLLNPCDCQCRAVANAVTANMVELEQHWATVTIECDSRFVARNLCLLRDLFELRALAIRNDAAGQALEAFYQLASLEARRELLELAEREAQDSVDRAAKLVRSGLPLDVDQGELAAQFHELQDRRLQLNLARLQFNGKIQKLTGKAICEHDFYLPQVDWSCPLAPLDAEAELARGLACRFDLQGLELLNCQLEKSTLRVARAALSVADGALGSVEPTEGWVHRVRCILCSDHEVGVRCRQLAMLYEDTEQLATGEIKGAVYEIVTQQHRVQLAQAAVVDARRRVEELSAKRDVDDVPVFQLSAARTRMFDAESKLIEQTALLKIAEVRLKRSQGLLPRECGFSPELCWDGCCDGACTECQPPTCRPGEAPCECKRCRRVQ